MGTIRQSGMRLLIAFLGFAFGVSIDGVQQALANGCGVPYEGTTYQLSLPSHFALLPACDPTWDFVLMADVDLDGIVITELTNFTGNFDGNFHVINNLTVSGGGLFDVGAAGATFTKVDLRNVVVEASGPNGWSGALVRDADGPVEISFSSLAGRIESTTGGNAFAGGFVGFAWDDLTILDSYVLADVIGGADGNGWAGGFVGNMDGLPGGAKLTVERSYFSGEISGGSAGNTWAGGIVGSVTFGSVEISDSYVRASLNGGSGPNSWAVGFIGDWFDSGPETGVVEDSYFEGSLNPGTGPNSFVNAISNDAPFGLVSTNSFCVDSCGTGPGTPATVEEIRSRTFIEAAGWDLGEVWCVVRFLNSGSPSLRTINFGPEDTRNCRRNPSRPKRRVEFSTNGGTCTWREVEYSDPWTVEFRGTLYLPTADDCRHPGHVFLGWSRSGPTEDESALLHESISRSATLTAVWGKLPVAPENLTVLANFFCGPCESVLIFWPRSSEAPSWPVEVVVDGIEVECSQLNAPGDLNVCLLTGLSAGETHVFEVAHRNQYGLGPAARTEVTLN